MSTARKLGLVLRGQSIKLLFACPASLMPNLNCYTVLHAQPYGEVVDATMLIRMCWGSLWPDKGVVLICCFQSAFVV